jgi:hypothetical protein
MFFYYFIHKNYLKNPNPIDSDVNVNFDQAIVVQQN